MMREPNGEPPGKQSTPTWREQYERARRWYERIAVPESYTTPSFSFDHRVDDVYAFFISCWHVKDWLKNDARVTVPDEVVESFVNGNLWLRLCADLANGVKHLTLDRGRRWEQDMRVEIVPAGPPAREIRLAPDVEVYVFGISNAETPPHLVARRCMNEWNTFLAEHGLLVDNGEYR